MKYYIIAGEASGDLHGGRLIQEIRANDPAANIRCWGGDRMEKAGAHLVKHYRELAFMGFYEVVANLGKILKNISLCKNDIAAFQPGVLILIDYPGFNLRIAKWAKRQSLRVVYYISPQVWAWKENRVKQMKRDIDLMITILPFEQDYFLRKWDWKVSYAGHPLTEAVDNHVPVIRTFSEKPVVAVLPGSRKQEIAAKLPIMLSVASYFPEYQFIVAMAPGVNEAFYQQFSSQIENVGFVGGLTYDLLAAAKAAMVTSGTATLETALFGVPEVVCYKGSAISYAIARRLVKVKYISLVNLIMDREVVKELIQDELTTGNLKEELKKLLTEPERREKLQSDYQLLRNRLTSSGSPSKNAADLLEVFLSDN